jgi:dipeptidyl aminopeptidase/acylaminoacyl peptidase
LPGVDAARVGIVGSSFGAYTASRVSDRIAGLRCCVFLAPVADPHALIERDMSPEAWALLRKQGWLEHHGQRLGADFFDTLPREDVPAKLARNGRPLLIYHGREDRQVPLEQGRAYESAMHSAGATVELHAIETSDHGMRGVTHTEMIIAGAAEWLTRFL